MASLTRNYTMHEFALQYFRKPQTLLVQTDGGAKEKAMASLVQYTKAPIQESLISLSDEDMNRQAVESFRTLMQFMGDQSKPRDKDEMDLLYELLKLCQEENLRDEIYCQVIKQVTGHPRPELCARGWKFLSLLTGFFAPSITLMPYLTKFLQDSGQSQGANGRDFQVRVSSAWEGFGGARDPSLAPPCRAGPKQPGTSPALGQIWGAPAAALPG